MVIGVYVRKDHLSKVKHAPITRASSKNSLSDMTRMTSARIAGFTILFYMAIGVIVTVLINRATSIEGTAAILARIAEHATDVRVAVLLELLECFSAVVLAVVLYVITRDEGHELAMLAMACRVGEGVLGAIGIQKTLGLLWIATAGAGTGGLDVATAKTLGEYLLMPSQSAMIGAPFFAVGSMIFSYLLLRGRIVPVSLAWLGVLASVLLVVGLPLQLAGFFRGPMTGYIWLPMVVFQIPLGLWLLIKGVATPARRQSA
jgi:hypothetical protein